MMSCLDVAGSQQRAGRSMTRAGLPAAIACLLINLCGLERAYASSETTVAAALKALAYVPATNAANAVDAANAGASVFATQPSPGAPPNGKPACYWRHWSVNI